ADATVATWHKKPGDAVVRDEVLVEIETDKVVLEVPASADGILAKYCPNATVLHIDIDPTSISKTVTADIPIVGDARQVLEQML
ncbi:hypothetical protein L1003_24375, partial [Escherichia coli]|uniref:biotin/lipoyl-containing protein n=1 Tax=Escherichia coli TaxID=562 RepID=UPI002AB29BDA